MANTDRARKLLVRTALVTSTTIATIVGAQNLAMLDANQFLSPEIPATDNGIVLSPDARPTPVRIAQAAPEIAILHAAPSIIILRQSGEVSAALPVTGSTNNNMTIQPPLPAQIAAPDPVILQQSVPQHSRSSR